MKTIFLFFLFYLNALFAGAQSNAGTILGQRATPIVIEWKSGLAGNFSFTKKWDYPEGIERLPTGKPGCADGGFCDPRAQAMQDENGRIPKDSLAVFYSLIDTTHRHYSIEGEARCYEYAGTNYLSANRSFYNEVTAQTEMNIATHCSLQLSFTGDTCRAQILLNSVASPSAFIIYYASSGSIQIDKKAWNAGVLKAVFNFRFANTNDSQKPMYWKGKIYTPIVEGEE